MEYSDATQSFINAREEVSTLQDTSKLKQRALLRKIDIIAALALDAIFTFTCFAIAFSHRGEPSMTSLVMTGIGLILLVPILVFLWKLDNGPKEPSSRQLGHDYENFVASSKKDDV